MEVKKLWFNDGKVFVETDKNEVLWQSLQWYPQLLNATDDQRNNYRIGGFGIHWSELDEDVSFESFTYEEREPKSDEQFAAIFKQFPEINISQLARGMGIPQSVFASYICGAKRPSAERKKQILEALHRLGRELTAVSL